MPDFAQFIYLMDAARDHAGALMVNMTVCGSIVELSFIGDGGKEYTQAMDLAKMQPTSNLSQDIMHHVTYIAGAARIALHPTAHEAPETLQ